MKRRSASGPEIHGGERPCYADRLLKETCDHKQVPDIGVQTSCPFVQKSLALPNLVETENQSDANHQASMSLGHCTSPANILNVTGPETLHTEDIVRRVGELLNKPVRFPTTPGDICYLRDHTKTTKLFGPPSVTAGQLIRWQAHWVTIGGRSLSKATHFENSDGAY